MKDDVVKGIDEAINNLKHEQEDGDKDIEELVEVESLSLEKDHSVSTSDTIKLDKIDEETIEESVENKEEVTEDKKEEVKVEDEKKIDENKELKDLNKKTKKSHKKKIIIISIICFIILLISLFLVWFFCFREKSEPEKVVVSTELSKKKQKNIINTYGSNMEAAVAIEYMNSKTILKYDEVLGKVHNTNKVECEVHEIYDDGKVYLDDCTIKGKKTSYSYGKKQEPVKEEVSDGTIINVYVNKTTGAATLTKPGDSKNFTTYTVNTGISYLEPVIIGDYVSYFDENYIGYMKNYKNDKKVLPGLDYTSVIPIKSNNYYDVQYVGFQVNNKWGVYDITTGVATVPCMYESIFSQFYMGVSGPPSFISPLVDQNIGVYNNGYSGVINYTNNAPVIPLIYKSILRSGNYLACADNYTNPISVFDFYGNEYLKDMTNKYGITDTGYVYVLEDNKSKLYSIDKTLIYDFGEFTGITKVNFTYGNIIQYLKDDNFSKCIEFSYDNTTKKGEVLDNIECGGVAKPVLYLYPEKKTNVTVSFEHPEFLETTYPKFKDNWKVTAKKDGTLIDKHNKKYYALYWDEKKVHSVDFSTGFYVERDDAIEFLERKLKKIGFNYKESNEFIMYWLPILEKNGKSLVYFELTDERESYNKINISPKPDSLLRVVIHIKKVDEKTSIKEEKLTTFKRSGFSAVEWGGTTY